MRKIFKSVIILLVGICLSVNLNAQSLTTGLIAYYKMDEASDSVLDAVGYLKGFSNGATANQSGKLGTSYSFDGTNDYIAIPRKSTYILDQEGCGIAMSVWIYPTVTTGYREIVTKLHEVGTNTSPYFSYQLSLFPASTGLSPRFAITTNGTNKYAYNNSIVVIPNQWNHIVGTYDCATMNLYLNGTLVATSSASGNITNFDEPLYIGATGAVTEVFQGRIDEIGVWSRNLSSGDVSYLYNGGDGITYPFNETPEEDPVVPVECEVDLAYLFENNVADSGTLSIDGVLKGGATYSTSGDSYEGDYSLRLTSTGQTLARRLVSAAPVNLSSGNGLTVSLWAKIENTGLYPALFMNKAGSLNTTGITLGTTVATREVYINVADGSTNNSINTGTGAYTFGEWTHFLFRFMDEDAQYANIWINGVLATEADSSLSITNWGKNDTICIGGYRNIAYPFTGNIDNVQIYRKAISDSDIQTLYEEGAAFYTVGCDTVPVHYVAETNLNDVIWFNTVYNAPKKEIPGSIGSPIGIHPSNPRYFIYNNEPKVVVTSGEHYGAVLNTDFDYITYLNTIQEDGLNGTRISIGTAVEYQGWYNILQNTWAPAPGKYLCPWARSSITTGGYYGGGNKFDLSDWDEVYFQRLKDFVAAAQEREIFVEVMLFSAIYSDDLWYYSPFKASNNIQGIGPSTRTNLLNLSHSSTTNIQKDVVAKIVTELNSYNNVWYEICNEPYLGNASNAWQDTILSTIRKTELTLPKKHLVSRNVANYYSNISPTLSPDIDIWNFHYAREARAYIDNLDLNKIIGNNETGFTQADSQYRREAYVALFSGAGLFNNLDYSFTVNDETGQVVPTGNPAGGGPTLREQLGHLRLWIQAFNFIEMSPSHSSITGLSSGTSGYCLKNTDDSNVLIFIRGIDGTFDIDLSSGEYSQAWFNTKTGSITQSTFTHQGGSKTFTAPSYTEDIALSIIKLSSSIEDPEIPAYNPYSSRNTLYVDIPVSEGGLGSPSNNGNSIYSPITVDRVSALYSSYDVIAFSDTIYYTSLDFVNWIGTSNSKHVIGTYWKYGNPEATLSGYKTLGTFTSIGSNLWEITDSDLPNSAYHNICDLGLHACGLLVTFGYLERSDGQKYSMGRYPKTSFLYRTSASTANPATYIEDLGTTFANGYWNGAYISFMDMEWWLTRAIVSSYSSGRYNFGTTTAAIGAITDNVPSAGVPYFLSNHPNACTQNGDWAYNPSTKKVTLYSSTNPTTYQWRFNSINRTIELTNCDYVTIENINIKGGVEAGLAIIDGSNISIEYSSFKHTGVHAIRAYSVNNLSVTNSDFEDCSGNGIYAFQCNGEDYSNNYFNNIGKDFQMAADISMGNAAIAPLYYFGNVTANENRINNTGHSGINSSGSYPGNNTVIRLERNMVTNACQVTGDGGGIYYGYSNYTAEYLTRTVEHYVRNNYVNTVGNPTALDWCYGGSMHNHGIYADEAMRFATTDSNIVVKARNGFYKHGPFSAVYKANIVYNPGYLYDNSAAFCLSEGLRGYAKDWDVQNNLVIARDSADFMLLFHHDASPTLTNIVVNNNKYFNPFNPSATNVMLTYSPFTQRTISYFRTTFGWENNTTWNSPSWTYQDVSGITRDQFVWIFYNWSAAPHTFSLGSATFRDPVTGASVSGTITLQPYKGRALFYASGSLSGVESPVYEQR